MRDLVLNLLVGPCRLHCPIRRGCLKYILRCPGVIIMKIEILMPLHGSKEIFHITSSGAKKIPVTPATKNLMFPEFLACAEKYCADNGFKLLNVENEKFYIYKE